MWKCSSGYLVDKKVRKASLMCGSQPSRDFGSHDGGWRSMEQRRMGGGGGTRQQNGDESQDADGPHQVFLDGSLNVFVRSCRATNLERWLK